MPPSQVCWLEKESLRCDGRLFPDSRDVDRQRKKTDRKCNRLTSSRRLRHQKARARLRPAKDRGFSNEATRGCPKMLCCHWAIRPSAMCSRDSAELASGKTATPAM